MSLVLGDDGSVFCTVAFGCNHLLLPCWLLLPPAAAAEGEYKVWLFFGMNQWLAFRSLFFFVLCCHVTLFSETMCILIRLF